MKASSKCLLLMLHSFVSVPHRLLECRSFVFVVDVCRMYDDFSFASRRKKGSLRGFFPRKPRTLPYARSASGKPSVSGFFFPFNFPPKFLACRSSACGHCSPLSSFLYTSNLISGGRVVARLPGMAAIFSHLEAITTPLLKMRPLYLWLSVKNLL